MLKYFLSSILFFVALSSMAQDTNRVHKGLRISIDLSPVVIMGFEPERVGIGASIDYEFKKNFFAVIEGGWLDYNSNHEAFNYKLDGLYAIAGADYSFLKPESRIDNDIFFVGLRYGFSSFQHQTDNISYTNYWGTYEDAYESEQLTGQWVEITFGLKAELYFAKNVFIGWTIRSKILTSGKNYDILEPYIIPGYGKTEKSFRFGVSWFIAYRIPFEK